MNAPLTVRQLASLRPGPTTVLQFDGRSPLQSREAESILLAALARTRVLVGQNIAFDIMVLRAHSPALRSALSGRHFLIDLSVLNFLQCELRPEKSLKDLGNVLGAWIYRDDERSHRYRSPSDPELHSYNGQDTHNTLTGAVILARRILEEFPNTDKLSPFCLLLYSDLIWTVVRMTESGVPYSRSALNSLFTSLHRRISDARAFCAFDDLLVDGEGSPSSQEAYLSRLFAMCPPETPVLLTEKTRKLSTSEFNRVLIASALHPDDPSQKTLLSWTDFKKSQKLLSTYVYPLLLGKRNDRTRRGAILLHPSLSLTPPPPEDLETWEPTLSIPPTPKRTKKSSSSPASGPPTPASTPPSGTSPPTSAAESPTSTPTPSPTPSSTSASSDPASSTSPTPTATSAPSPASPASSASSTATNFSRTPHDPRREATPLLAEPPPDLRGSGSLGGATQPESPQQVPLPGGEDQVRAADVYLAHPSWFITPSPFKDDSSVEGGTLQARITCKDPPEQTAPKAIQACRRSRFPGGVLLVLDLKQIELCVPALLSGEPTLIDPITAGDDLHSLRAPSVFGLPYLLSKYPVLRDQPTRLWKSLCPEFDEHERQVCKRVNFAEQFRAGWEKIRASIYDDIGIWVSPELLQRVVAARPTDRPVLWAWQESLIADARRDGYLALPFTGQSRSFLGGSKFDVNEIVNFPVQTTAANVMLRLQALLHAELPPLHLSLSFHRTHMCCNTYDAILFDCASPALLSELKSLLPLAFHRLCTQDYWGMLQSLFNRKVPLSYSLKEIA